MASPVKSTVYALFTGDATLSYNGSGTFQINTSGQPVVTGTVISSTAFNSLTADLATGLSTAITKDGQTTVTANIPLAGYKITGLGAATVGTDAVRYSQLQGSADKLLTVTGTDTYVATASPALTAYAAGNLFSLVVPNTNTGASTINIDGLGAKAITRTGSTALVAGDMIATEVVIVVYDGTRFQLINGNNLRVAGTTSGIATIVTPAVAGTPTITLPIVTGTLATLAGTETLTNKTLPNTFGFKNRAINGDVRIDQTNAGAAVTVNSSATFFFADMVEGAGMTAAGVFTVQQVATTPPTGFKNYLRTTVTTADASPAAASIYLLRTKVEGLNVIDFSLGTANAIAFTVSFYVRSSLTGAFSGALNNAAFNRSFPFSFTINAANTWEQKTVTLTGDLTGTWAIDNTVGLALQIDLGSGSTYRSTASTWQAGNYIGVTGAVRLISTVSSTFDITGVQIEAGSVATSWDYRDYQSELARCQRYLPALVSGSTFDVIGVGGAFSTTQTQISCKFNVPARVVVTGITVSAAADFTVNDNAVNYTCTAVVFGQGGLNGCFIQLTIATASLTLGRQMCAAMNATGKYILFTGARL